YEIYYEIVLGGRFAKHIDKLHEHHGPIVRVNSFEVHINNHAFYDSLYDFDPHLEKRGYHIQNVQHTGDYETHKRRRRALAPFLAPTAIQKLEPLIKHNISQLCTLLSKAQHSQETVLLSHLYRCMTADIITKYTLGHSYDLLSKPVESASFLKAFAFTFRFLWLLREIKYLGTAVRWIGKLVGKYMTGTGVIPTLLRWQWKIDRQLQGFHQGDTKAFKDFPAIIPTYINSSLPSHEKRGQPLHDVTIMLLAAGFETTGFTLTTATYHILSNPHIHLRLQQELRLNIPSASEIPPWRELSKLPYLSAIIKESLRLSLGATARLPRINKEKDIIFGEGVIPKGTAISMSHSDLHYNKDVFPEPTAFKSERWLMGEESKQMEKFLVPFSRVLVGKGENDLNDGE
ncbi:hypothetical protein Q9189_007275, partial [Teloschistes chrysophthalmus]